MSQADEPKEAITIKMAKYKHKERILKAAREKQLITYESSDKTIS